MTENFHLITPVTLATLKKDQLALSNPNCPSDKEPPQCCSPIDQIMKANPPTIGASTIYLIMLFGLVIYTLGLKMIGCVLYLSLRMCSRCGAKRSNKRRQKETIRRQEMVASPMYAQQDTDVNALSAEAIAAGWSAQVDPATGRTYYQNTTTGQTDWEPPSVVM